MWSIVENFSGTRFDTSYIAAPKVFSRTRVFRTLFNQRVSQSRHSLRHSYAYRLETFVCLSSLNFPLWLESADPLSPFLSQILFDLFSQRLPCPTCQAHWRMCQRHRLWMSWWRCLWFANRCSRAFTLTLPLLAPRKTCRSVRVNVFECKSSATMRVLRVLRKCEWLHIHTLNWKLLVLVRNEMVRELPLGVSSIVNIFHISESECAGACSWEGVLVFRRNVIW